MAKPIPVFAFVFAAFAATSPRAQSARASADNPNPRGEVSVGLQETWRLLRRRRLGVSALVGVVGDGGDGAAEALWLTDVHENGEQLVGVAAESPHAGERIGFTIADVLDWRIVEPLGGDGALLRAVGPRARDANPGPSGFGCAPEPEAEAATSLASSFNIRTQLSGNASISLHEPSAPRQS